MRNLRNLLWMSVLTAPIALFAMLSPNSAAAQWETAFVEVEQARGFPVRGESRDSVRRKFGEPSDSRAPVGRPPISSWVYPEFTVYFEFDLVITTVAEKDALPTRLADIQ